MDDQQVVRQVDPDHLQDDAAGVRPDPDQPVVEVALGWSDLRLAGCLHGGQHVRPADPMFACGLGELDRPHPQVIALHNSRGQGGIRQLADPLPASFAPGGALPCLASGGIRHLRFRGELGCLAAHHGRHLVRAVRRRADLARKTVDHGRRDTPDRVVDGVLQALRQGVSSSVHGMMNRPR
jgi:hypothetical protein